MAFGLLLAVFVGVTLGLAGSGGTILTVPILVYVMGVDPVLATTYSLFAVGVTALAGSVKGFAAKLVDFRQICAFGLPSLLMVFVMRTFVLPLVPEVIRIGPWEVHQSVVLMVLFALVMLASSVSMIGDREDDVPVVPSAGRRGIPVSLVIVQGLFVGMVTGTVGAGGGFLIVPALVNFFGMPMKGAVSCSLVIIAANSFFGLLGDLEKIPDFDWPLLLGYTFFAVAGLFIGFALSGRMDGRQMRKLFGYLVLVMGIYVLVRELTI